MSDFATEVRRHLDGTLAATLGDDPAAKSLDVLAADLVRYAELLLDCNTRLNLTRITDPEGVAVRHLLDSLLALPLLDGTGPVLDLGSGGGAPGIPLALARPKRLMILCESRGKKAAVLQEMVDALQLGPRVSVAAERAEALLKRQRADVVVARAVGRIDALLTLLSPVRHRFRRLLLYKGPGVDAELDAVRGQLRTLGFAEPERHEHSLPGDAGRRVLLVFAGGRQPPAVRPEPAEG